MNDICGSKMRKDESCYAWKDVPDGPITLGFSQCKNADDIHQEIKIKFGFPDWYGENWDALWDCLRDIARCEKKIREVQITGYERLSVTVQSLVSS